MRHDIICETYWADPACMHRLQDSLEMYAQWLQQSDHKVPAVRQAVMGLFEMKCVACLPVSELSRESSRLPGTT